MKISNNVANVISIFDGGAIDTTDESIDQLIDAGDHFIEATLALKAAKTRLAICAEQYANAYEAFYHKPLVKGVSI